MNRLTDLKKTKHHCKYLQEIWSLVCTLRYFSTFSKKSDPPNNIYEVNVVTAYYFSYIYFFLFLASFLSKCKVVWNFASISNCSELIVSYNMNLFKWDMILFSVFIHILLFSPRFLCRLTALIKLLVAVQRQSVLLGGSDFFWKCVKIS